MVKENGIFKIMPAAGVKGSLSPQLGGAITGFTMQVVPLKFVGAKEMGKILENVAADPTLVKVDELRNLLILAGTQNEVRHMMDTVDMFDVDWISGMSVGMFVMQSADVKTIDQELSKVFGDKGVANPLAGVVKLIPIERLNAFVIITPQPKYLEQAKLWLERFDRVGSTGGTQLYVYHVQNGKAEHLAELLNQAFGGQKSQTAPRTPAASVTPGQIGTQLSSFASRPGTSTTSPGGSTNSISSGSNATTNTAAAQAPSSSTLAISDGSGGATEQVKVVADAQNNALLILANAAGYEKIESALKKLDTSPRQVLIEVTIAEVTLKDELKYGIEWLFTNGPRRGGKLDLGTEGLNAIVPGFSYAITSATSDTIKSVLNMLASDNKLNILSSPHIMVSDNQTAKIQVGDSVPTAGPQTVSGTGVVVSSVQYLDTGVLLSVTPRINAGGLVNLDITQEVSTASATTTSGLNSPTISKRAAKTVVAVQSGETMVLGGLMSERSNNESAGLPGLSSIPILGGLFGTQARSKTVTELVVLITPRVASNFNQAKTLSDELRRKMGQAKDLIDCGTSNVLGYTTRGGLWCLQPGRFDGAVDKMNEFDYKGEPLYLKEPVSQGKSAN
jgi:general secretion pathway protein D